MNDNNGEMISIQLYVWVLSCIYVSNNSVTRRHRINVAIDGSGSSLVHKSWHCEP